MPGASPSNFYLTQFDKVTEPYDINCTNSKTKNKIKRTNLDLLHDFVFALKLKIT